MTAPPDPPPDVRKKVRFKLSPELVDGDHWTVVDRPADAADAVKRWCEELHDCPGEGCSIETVEMTDAEVDALPEI